MYVRPKDEEDLLSLLRDLKSEDIPRFLLGGGANILVADRGIRGIVIDMSDISSIELEDAEVISGAGTAVSDVSDFAAAHALSGMEFIYRMPGSLGGALWMNARCYGRSISDLQGWIRFIDRDLELQTIPLSQDQFAYKSSPFQQNGGTIVQAGFRLETAEQDLVYQKMRQVEEDRRKKGHFDYPSAGSVFKNNRDFGEPTGKILDAYGVRGMRSGGAQVSSLHANIIVNTGGATASDVSTLVTQLQNIAFRERGIRLEPEIRFIGEWGTEET